MTRRLLVLLLPFAAAAAQPSPSAIPASDPTTIPAIADFYLQGTRAATASVWPDYRDSTRNAGRVRIDRVRDQLRAAHLDADTSAANQLVRENLLEVAEGSIAARICRFHLWSTPNQFSGWHVSASNWARTVRVTDDSSHQRALTLLRELPRVMRAERALLERGLDSGYTSSKAVIAAVMRQFGDLLPDDALRSPLDAPAQRAANDAFAAAWRATLKDSVYPAAAEYRQFLEQRYTPRARADGSLSLLPNGVDCYAASLRAQTSAQSDLPRLKSDARRELTAVHDALRPLTVKLTGEQDIGRAVQLLRADPRYAFPARDSILPEYRRMTAVAAQRIGRVISGFSPETLEVIAYPEFQERAGLPPQYIRAPEDGSRAAQFLVNLSRTERMSVPNAVAHEAYPGHHLQRVAAYRAASAHAVMRSLSVGGFTEGWGIYSEVLGDDMGLYDSDLTRAGYLVHVLDVSVAAYLDVGYHAEGWTRAMLVDSMMVLGGRPRAMAEAYADRHAGTPGQLATYFVGYNAIMAARRDAERALGARFNLAEFNREVIRDGSVTLASMRSKVDRWITTQK